AHPPGGDRGAGRRGPCVPQGAAPAQGRRPAPQARAALGRRAAGATAAGLVGRGPAGAVPVAWYRDAGRGAGRRADPVPRRGARPARPVARRGAGPAAPPGVERVGRALRRRHRRSAAGGGGPRGRPRRGRRRAPRGTRAGHRPHARRPVRVADHAHRRSDHRPARRRRRRPWPPCRRPRLPRGAPRRALPDADGGRDAGGAGVPDAPPRRGLRHGVRRSGRGQGSRPRRPVRACRRGAPVAGHGAAPGAGARLAGRDLAPPRRRRRLARRLPARGGGRYGMSLRRPSVRARVVGVVVAVTAVGLLATGLRTHAIQTQQIMDDVSDDFDQEIRELQRLADAGTDPETGERFRGAGRLMSVAMEQNVPGSDEMFLSYLDGELQQSNPPTQSRVVADSPVVQDVVDGLTPRSGRTVQREIETEVGRVWFVVVPVTVPDRQEVGAYVLASALDRALATERSVMRTYAVVCS